MKYQRLWRSSYTMAFFVVMSAISIRIRTTGTRSDLVVDVPWYYWTGFREPTIFMGVLAYIMLSEPVYQIRAEGKYTITLFVTLIAGVFAVWVIAAWTKAKTPKLLIVR